jgi:2-haloacid dehalogenase
MPAQPSVIVFDVNETLSDMAPMSQRFVDVGAPAHLAKLWFAMLLRDGFALTAAGGQEKFGVLGEGILRSVFEGVELDRDLDAAVEHVLAGFGTLPVHSDVSNGVRGLRTAGYRLVTLTNGSTAVAEQLFDRAGIRDEFEALLSVEDADAWKPARAAYEYAARRCSVEPTELLLVAAHPWDIDGAARAGLTTAWINRTGGSYPGYFNRPTYTVAALTDLAAALTPPGAHGAETH